MEVTLVSEESERLSKLDRGVQPWIVCAAATLTFGLYLGFEFKYGLIYSELIKRHNSSSSDMDYAGI
jgi:hypothetical protein